MQISNRVDKIIKTLDNIDTEGIRVILQMITNFDNQDNLLTYNIKVKDRYNNIIEEEPVNDIPRLYIERYQDKYKVNASMEVIKIQEGKTYKNGVLINEGNI